ncbi:hypothetical protein FBU30_007272 [Linnemannia zychae]|nr:hypothetical protein FBU30_007272 [Linnemannia zychae]
MYIPVPTPLAGSLLVPVDENWKVSTTDSAPGIKLDSTDSTIIGFTTAVPGTTTRRHRDSISFFLPIFIISILLVILLLSLIFARCLYRRFKTMHLSPSPSNSSWKAYSSTTYGSNGHTHNYYGDHSDAEEGYEEDERAEQERLLARRRSTSYYDANRSRAPVAMVIQHDAKGRPISTWSTASSVAAQRGEELSKWSRRRDDLIKIYGQSQLNTSSFAEEDAEDEESSDAHQPQGLTERQESEQGHDGRGEGPLDRVPGQVESHTHSHSHSIQNENSLLDPHQHHSTQNSQRSSRATASHE